MTCHYPNIESNSNENRNWEKTPNLSDQVEEKNRDNREDVGSRTNSIWFPSQ